MQSRTLKAGPLGVPGDSVERHRQDLINDAISTVLLIPALLWFLALTELFGRWRDIPRMPEIFAPLAMIATAWAWIRLRQLRRKSESLRLGRDGERVVGQMLHTFDFPGLRIFHDVPAPGFNLDHVLVCNHGIYVIETKAKSKSNGNYQLLPRNGQIFAKGKKLPGDPIAQAVAQSRWLEDRIEEITSRRFRCQPVVVFPEWWVEPMDTTTKAQAWVLNPKNLPAFVEREPQTLTEADMQLVDFAIRTHYRAATNKDQAA